VITDELQKHEHQKPSETKPLDAKRLDVSRSEVQSCWPTPRQQLLLQATLWQGEKARRAWDAWRGQIDIENLDEGSTRLLPLLLHNLKNLGVSDPLSSRYKSVTRYTWYRNQMMFGRAAKLLRAFEEAGVQTMILKGTPLILLYYKELGLRPMNDFDLMVPTKQSGRALELLEEWGWDPDIEEHLEGSDEFLTFRHAHAFRNADDQSIDLHRHLLSRCCWENADDEFWKAAISVELQGVSTLALCPSDQLLHVCLHAMEWQSVSPLRWVSDAMIILQAAENSDDPNLQINWQRLEKFAASHRVHLPLYDGLKFLREKMEAPIPNETLSALKRMKSTRAERLEYSASMRPPHSFGPLLKLWLRYRSFLRWEQKAGPMAALLGFPRYLQHTWELESVAQVPAAAIKKSRRQLRQQRNWRQVAVQSKTKKASRKQKSVQPK
jgi:hypothetical protein